MSFPTPYPNVNGLVFELLQSVQAVLGDHFIGLYLDGSLANGGFDQASDIDFVVVTDEELSSELLSALQAMHDRIASLDSPWATQLEGSYVSRAGLRRYDPEHALFPNIERGLGERLKMEHHGDWWTVHRYILRESGITVTGPAPQSLIDPVTPDELREAMLPVVHDWAAKLLERPELIQIHGYQSYIVLSLCRVLFTLRYGKVASKLESARWAQSALGEKWSALIQRAWIARSNPQPAPPPEDIQETMAFIRFVLNRRGDEFIGE